MSTRGDCIWCSCEVTDDDDDIIELPAIPKAGLKAKFAHRPCQDAESSYEEYREQQEAAGEEL